jgi:hypothetical protein
MENFTNPKAPTLATTYDASISGSTSVSLNSGATYIEVTALLKGIFMKWGATASSSSFDEFIAPDVTNTYIIPAGTSTVEFIEEAASAHLIVIQK